MTDTRTLTRKQLLHLVDRARRGVILPTELDDLHAGIVATCDRVEFYEAATSRMRDRAEVATVRAEKAQTAHHTWETRTLLARARVTELEADVARLRASRDLLQRGAIERSALLEEARDALESAGINEAHGGESWPRLVPAIEELAATVARLTAGQCTHHVGICALHHTTPVTGCPYPRCTTKQQTGETAL